MAKKKLLKNILSVKQKITKNLIFAFFYVLALFKIMIYGIDNVAFLFCSCFTGNMGDHAITYSEIHFLKNKFNKITIEIPYFIIEDYLFFWKKIVKYNIVFIQGGGFIGSLWPEGHRVAMLLIKEFEENSIVFFPQTLFFESNKKNDQLLFEFKKAMNNHKRIVLFTREKVSYDFARNECIKNVILIPDMVTFLNLEEFNIFDNRNNGKILVCFRNDKEKNISNKYLQSLKNIKFDFELKDTDLGFRIFPIFRKHFIKKLLLKFCYSKFIITDRLHGMVFSAIAGTRCLAYSNCNHKIFGVYNWIKNNKYISYSKKTICSEELIRLINNDANFHFAYNNHHLRKFQDKMYKIIKKLQ